MSWGMTTAPVASREIATVVMKAWDLNPDDAELLVTIRQHVGARMWKLNVHVEEKVKY